MTQEDFQFNTKKDPIDCLNESKPIVEDDLFAESPSPPQQNSPSADITSSAQHLKYTKNCKEEDFKFTLSLEVQDQKPSIVKRTANEFTKLNQESTTTQKRNENYNVHQTNESFREGGIEQLESSCPKNTKTIENDLKCKLAGNDTIFEQLCNKYLNRETAVHRWKETDVAEQPSQIRYFRKTPPQCDNFLNISLEFDIKDDIRVSGWTKARPFTAETPSKLPVENSKTNLSKSQSCSRFNLHATIDLTQNTTEYTNEPDDDDGCLMLSDDEINYSIWQANKTFNLNRVPPQCSPESKTSLPSNISSSDDDYENCQKEKVIEFSFNEKDEKEYSYLDLEEKENSLIKVNLAPAETFSDLDILTSKYATSHSAGQEETKFQLNEFGILEEYSQNLDDYTSNPNTPTNPLAQASFLRSPAEMPVTMKSSNKFNNFLMDEQAKSPIKFEEFDTTMSPTLPNGTNYAAKKPQGLDQLLTAEISFAASENTPIVAKKSSSEMQEVTFNNKTYSVRYTNSPKPDYTTYSESELLKQLYNYGIKPLKRKQAVKMLEYIYNQTHPILMEDAESADVEVGTFKDDFVALDDFELPCTSKESLQANKYTFSDSSVKETAVNRAPITSRSNTFNFQDSCGLTILRYAHDLKAELQDEIYILQTNVTKKVS